MYNGKAPEYLCNMLPPLVNESTATNLCSGKNITVLVKEQSFFGDFLYLQV